MYRFLLKGIVQGVGFRPYIYRKAKSLGLVGYVKNVGCGVEIVVNDKDFVSKLNDLPPLAKIFDYTREIIHQKKEYSDFSIIGSSFSEGETLLPADIFMCNRCLSELRDKKNRRYNYYFITCTDCGPRFTIIEDYPYDRPFTSMKDFKMCNKCAVEYFSPMDRRYHAQTIACKNCGPKLRLLKGKEDISGDTDVETIKIASKLILEGKPVAIKGVGGFHLCSKADCVSVMKVRSMLSRPNKPFAVMVRDEKMLEGIAIYDEKERELLNSPQRPIVVLKKKNPDSFFEVSELDSIGVMFPYTALHYLLFDFIDEPLVMTSCNIPGEPVAITEKLADYYLTHERRIVNRCDDSVLKVNSGNVFYLRRSRGFTPLPVRYPIFVKDTIALGAELNNSICVAKKDNCYLSQYIGESSKLETFNFLKESTDKFIRLTRLNPKIIACDLHPNYNSGLYAEEIAKKYNAKLIRVQHHKAHVASVASEHGLTDYIGIAIDGLGYGEDGTIWGGEVFDVSEGVNFKRIGHLEPHLQLGGDSATIYPNKMLFSILSKFLSEDEIIKEGIFSEEESKLYFSQISQKYNCPITTSTGRVLDAASAMLGFCDFRSYDGRPAMILESKSSCPYFVEPVIYNEDGKSILSTTEIFRFLYENKGLDKSRLAATLHYYIANGLFSIAQECSLRTGKKIVCSGGVAYNRIISSILINKGVLFNKEIPAGDGGICYGQAYLANLIEKLEK